MSEATWRPVDETEAHLVSSISDDATCAVYGDWLEERGDIDRAEFLRVYQTLRSLRATDPRTVWLSHRLTILRRNVDPAWHAQIERTHHVEVEVEVAAPEPPPPPPRRTPPRRFSPRSSRRGASGCRRTCRAGSPSAACSRGRCSCCRSSSTGSCEDSMKI